MPVGATVCANHSHRFGFARDAWLLSRKEALFLWGENAANRGWAHREFISISVVLVKRFFAQNAQNRPENAGLQPSKISADSPFNSTWLYHRPFRTPKFCLLVRFPRKNRERVHKPPKKKVNPLFLGKIHVEWIQQIWGDGGGGPNLTVTLSS